MAGSYRSSMALMGPNWRDDLRRMIEGERDIEVEMKAEQDLEATMRAVCEEKGIEFSPQMQAVCKQQVRAEGTLAPTLDEQFAKFGGVEKFLSDYCPLPGNRTE